MIRDTGNNAIDSVMGDYSWKAAPSTPATITYSFMTRLPGDASSEDAAGFAPMNMGQMQAARDALSKWSSVANLTFLEVGDGAGGGQIQFGTNYQYNQSSAYAITFFDYRTITGSRIYLNNQDPYNFTYTPGAYGPMVLVHEIGHSLGLKHPGAYNAGSGELPSGPFLPMSTDNTDYSVMSYNDGSSSIAMDRFPAAPMLYDILAIQHLYGANRSYRSGNDVYRFADDSIPQCIWDGGGANTLDFSACRTAAVINLNAGGFSSTSQNLGNISIAFGTLIQHAIGSAGDDTIYTNSADNNIQCGSGNDTVYLSSGNDVISGGLGRDTAVFTGNRAAYTITSSSAGHTIREISGVSTYFLSGVELFKFNDVTIASNIPPSIVQPLADHEISAGTTFRLTIPIATFSDADAGDILTYRATLADGRALPAWLSFDASSRSFLGAPTDRDLGPVSVRVTATDPSNAAIHDDFVINVFGKGMSFYGTQVNETFNAGAGNDLIDGGNGLDSVIYSSARANFLVSKVGNSTSIKDTIGNGGVDTLTGIERVRFADKALAFDVDGVAGQTYRLYQAAFDRKPDLPGIGWQIKHMDMGMDLRQLASNFMVSPEFSALYGTNLSNAGLITQLYRNVLHREPEQAGFDFWMDILGTGKQTRNEVLMNFSESVENKAQVIGSIQNGIEYLYFA